MNIKSEKNGICKKFIEKHKSLTTLYIIVFMMISIILFGIDYLIAISNYKKFATELVKKDYPAVICLSPNGQFRVYEEKTYTVHKHVKNGWNIYLTSKGPTNSSSFHLSKCEIK